MKKEKWIDIIFWSWILFGTIAGFAMELKEESMSFEMLIGMIKENPSFVLSILGMLLMMFIFQFIQNGIITIGYIAYKIVMKKHRKERIEKVDIKNDEYYREIIPKYSAAVLSYVDDFTIGENDITATILTLKLKKCIEIHENEIEILNENIELAENEKYILECLKNNLTISIPEFQKHVTRDAVNSKLIEAKIDIGKKFKNARLFGLGSFVLGMFLFFITILHGEIVENINKTFGFLMIILYFIFIFACLTFFPIFAWIKYFMYIGVKVKDPYLRTKEGKDINKKIEGLRKYILDFSMMEEKNKEELIIWEEYLIYSVIFGINKKASEDVLKMIKID